MSAIDQAFIRAYDTETMTPSPPPAAPAPCAQQRIIANAPQPAVASLPAQTAAATPAPHPVVPESAPQAPAPPPGDGSSPSGRRPLSSFAQPQTVECRFKPALEVDYFRWSTTCNELVQRHAAHFAPAVNALLAADDAGRSLIGIGASARSVGCTTIVACLARLLVDAGKTVAIVDGNFAAPGLARQLGLVVDSGWEEILAGSLPLAEGVIHSLADGIAVLPLLQGGAAAALRLDAIHSSVTAGVLRYHYDMVLFDLGALTDGMQGPIAQRLARQCRLDGVILTAGLGPATSTQTDRIAHTAPDLAAICLGVVENQLRAA